jgi:hypothetical protein
MNINFKRYGLYLLRWQASTPILAAVSIMLAAFGQIIAAIIANLIGGLIFFWVDQFIFTSKSLDVQWEVKERTKCVDCGKVARGYRLVKSGDYDRTNGEPVEFRCEQCSTKKSELLKKQGVKTD